MTRPAQFGAGLQYLLDERCANVSGTHRESYRGSVGGLLPRYAPSCSLHTVSQISPLLMDREPIVKAVSPGLSSIMVETPDNAFVFIRPLQMFARGFGQNTARGQEYGKHHLCAKIKAFLGLGPV